MDHDIFKALTDSFLSWLPTMGIQMNPKISLVDMRESGKSRGIVALADIDEDEVLFSIPRLAVLNIDTALSRLDSSAIRHAIESVPNWLALTTVMLTEGLRKDSRWAPYLAILPSQLDSLVFWTDVELSELQASAVVQRIGKAHAEEMFRKHISPLRFENGNTEMCHRVASVIMAYAFDIPEKMSNDENSDETDDAEELVSDDEEDEKTILSMIPLADMLNADADRNNARLCCDNVDLEMRSIKPIPKGEEIFNDYGQLPRSDLLRRYGYVTENYSPYDVAEISTKLIVSMFRSSESIVLPNGQSLRPLPEVSLEQRLFIAEREAVLEDSYEFVHPGPDSPSIPDDLLALIYIMLLDEENFKALESSQSALPSRSKLTTELVGQVLVKAISLRENEYATTIHDDEVLLRSGRVTGRAAMALQVRYGEKAVLRKAIREATTFIANNKRMRAGKSAGNDSLSSNKGKRKMHEQETGGRKKGKR